MRCNGYNSQNEEMAQWCSGKYQSADVDSEKLSGGLPILSGGLSDSVYSDRQLRNLSDKARCGLGPKQNNIYQRKRSYQIRLKLESPGSVFRGPQHLQLGVCRACEGRKRVTGKYSAFVYSLSKFVHPVNAERSFLQSGRVQGH